MALIHVVVFIITDDSNYFITSQIWCAACCAGSAIIDKLNK